MSGMPIDSYVARFGDVFRWGGLTTGSECLVMFVSRHGDGITLGQRNWVGMCLSDLSNSKVGAVIREWNPAGAGWTLIEAVPE